MSLPTNRELREMLEYASPYPWRREGGFIRPAPMTDTKRRHTHDHQH